MLARLIVTLGCLAASCAQADTAPVLRDRARADRPALVVVGVPHFSNPGADRTNVEMDDVLSKTRQREIAHVVDRLAAFGPTRVVVEYPAEQQARLDARYRDYRAGRYTLTRNEIDQIGLQLAARLDLDRVDAADWNDYPPGNEADYDFEAWAKANGQAARLAALSDPDAEAKRQDALRRSTIAEYLCIVNGPAALARDEQAYFDIALFGDLRRNPGAVWVGNWHARNLRIFANLVRIAARPRDRVVVIYGAGHKPLLDRYAERSGAFAVHDARAALGCD